MKPLRSNPFRRSSLAALAIALMALLPACQTPSPTSRIAQKPGAFQALPAQHKELVTKGEVTEGMSKEAVWLAWGSPTRRLTAGQSGKVYEMWRYTGLQPIYTQRSSMHTSFCRDRHGRVHFHPGVGYDMGPDYVPYTAAEVKFSNNLVSSWERVK